MKMETSLSVSRYAGLICTVLCMLFDSSVLARATNESVATSSDHHMNHYLDMRERMDHMEDKLDAATCKLDQVHTEIREKLHAFESQQHSHESLLDSKLETLELKLEKNLRSEINELLTLQMERVISTIRLLQVDQRQEKVASGLNNEVGGPFLDQNDTRAPYCCVNPGLENQIEVLTQRTDDCLRAANGNSAWNVSSNEPYPRQASPHEWITILRRVNGRVNFSRDWEEYKSGFGDLGGEFWLGLEDIHQITSRRSHRLRVVLTDFSGEVKFAEYSDFFLTGGATNYRLHVTGYTKGSTAGDSLSWHSGMDFTTQDNDNDKKTDGNCAVDQKGGWWYNVCDNSHLTGQYLPHTDRSDKGIAWYYAYSDNRSFKAAEMSIRED